MKTGQYVVIGLANVIVLVYGLAMVLWPNRTIQLWYGMSLKLDEEQPSMTIWFFRIMGGAMLIGLLLMDYFFFSTLPFR